MVILFDDYKSSVLQDYSRKKAKNALSFRLVHPTPGNIQEECLAVCKERFSRKDEQVFRTFFGQGGDVKSVAQAIERCDIDKFRPLVNFLKKQTCNTDVKNVELLAWLVNYEPRPYEQGRTVGPKDSDISEIGKELPQTNFDIHHVMLPEKDDSIEDRDKKDIPLLVFYGKPYSKLKVIIVFASIIILMSVGGLVYWTWYKSSGIKLTGQQKCMYWTGDHYQQIPCSRQKFGDTMVIAFDSVRFYNFKRITNPDTISKTAIGRVWYIRINGKLECYTADGYHPINPRLRLKPITAFIIDKYLKQGQESK